MCQRNFADVIKSEDLEMEKVSWITQVGSIWSKEALKTENFSWLRLDEEVNMNEGFKRCNIAAFKDGGRDSQAKNCIGLSHEVCGNLLWQLKKTNTGYVKFYLAFFF